MTPSGQKFFSEGNECSHRQSSWEVINHGAESERTLYARLVTKGEGREVTVVIKGVLRVLPGAGPMGNGSRQ